MTLDLTPEDIELLRDALDDSLRDARQARRIYGHDQSEFIAAIKALRVKLTEAA